MSTEDYDGPYVWTTESMSAAFRHHAEARKAANNA